MSEPYRRPCVYHFTLDGRQVLGFDTGLDSRSFARARLANLLAEPAHIVFPDGEHKSWKAEGVAEICNGTPNGAPPTMHFFGTPFKGTRLDLILNSGDRNLALSAILAWLKAHLALGGTEAPLLPFSAFIGISSQSDLANAAEGVPDASGAVSGSGAIHSDPSGTVYFAQTDIINCCIQKLEPQAWNLNQRYVNPGLTGIKALTFTAAAMLYQIFGGSAPFTAADEQTLHEDMKDSNFLPIAFAAPGLDETIATFIQEALTVHNETPESTVPVLTLLRRFKDAGTELQVDSFFRELSSEEKAVLLEEKTAYQKKRNITLSTARFIAHNKTRIIAVTVAAFVLLFFLGSIISAQLRKPTTKGMDSLAVVESYYAAFNLMDNRMMEACVYRGAGKSDISMVTNFFVVTKMRQAYERSQEQFIPAQRWLENGKEPQKLPVFGITDLQITLLDESNYRAVFTFWFPHAANDPEQEETLSDDQTQEFFYTDELKLQKIKGDWRIVEIMRNGKIR